MWARKQTGFTIVELLIVIVVIAILAAITIVAYNGITQRANASAAQSAVSQAMKKLAVYAVDNAESYPTDLESLGVISGGGVSFQYTANNSTDPKGYCVTATTNGISYYLGKNFTYTSGSTNTINQSNSQTGACPGHSGTGNAAITNFAPNPSIEVNTANLNGPNQATIATSSTRAYRGSQSVLVTMPTARAMGNTGIGVFVPTSYVAAGLKPSTTYTATAYVYVPTGTVSIQVSVQGSGRTGNVNPPERITYLKDQWVRIQNTFTTTATDGNISVYLLNNETTPGTTTQFWADAIMVTEGTGTPTYADGSTAGWVWNGSANAASSSGPAL